MKNPLKSKPLCGKPINFFFTGKDKFLRLQKYTVADTTPPISEIDSIFVLVNKGKGSIVINGVEFNLKTDDLLWLQAYHTFTITSDLDDPLELYILVYDYALSSFLTFEEPSQETIDEIIYASPLLEENNETKWHIRDLFENFEELNESYDPGSSLIKVSILGELSTFFIRQSYRDAAKNKLIERPLGWNVILYLSEHFSEDLHVNDVAERFDTTANALNHELRSVCGYNFEQTLNNIRVQIAASALLYDEMSLASISEHCGFTSETAFYRIFKRCVGLTPNEYRNEVINTDKGVYRNMILSVTMMEILNYAYENFSDSNDLETASKTLYISKKTISDSVYKKFGSSYKDLNTLTRIRHAKAMLLTSDMPILDIAISVGFKNSNSFARAFKKIYGVLPSEYRASQKKELKLFDER